MTFLPASPARKFQKLKIRKELTTLELRFLNRVTKTLPYASTISRQWFNRKTLLNTQHLNFMGHALLLDDPT